MLTKSPLLVLLKLARLLPEAASGNLKKVSLELGGKSPTIVFPDADIDAAIAGAASAIFFNHGQCCCAGSRLFAHEKVFDKVTEGISKIAENIKVGPGMETTTEMGPLVSDEQYQKVAGYIESGKSEGGEIVAEENMITQMVVILFTLQFLQKQTKT